MALPLSETQLIEFAKAIELSATKILEGLHQSPRGGQGVEFHSTLPYSEGDDIKFLDWKRLASSEKYFVNKFQREEKSGWTILLDSSESMTYGSKAHWARLWSGAILFLAKVWGDSWSFVGAEDGDFEETVQLLGNGKGGVPDISQLSWDKTSNDRLLILSDFFWPLQRLRSILDEASQNFSSVALFQVLDPKEISFEFSGVVEFADLESTERLILDSKSVKSVYLKKLRELQAECQKRVSDSFLFMTFPSEGEKLEAQLLKFFEQL
jgi:hypothetical protein